MTSALAVAVSGPEPSDGLRSRILANVRAEDAGTTTADVIPLEPRRSRRRVPLLVAASSLAATVALGLGLYAIALQGRLGETRTALAQERAAAAVLADPSARTVALSQGRGRLVVAATGAAVIVLEGLAPPPRGKTYQVWVVEGGQPRSAALFEGGGREVVVLGRAVARGDVVAVTLERSGGAAAPTGVPLAASRPV